MPPPFVSRGTDSARGLLPSGVEPEGHGVKKSGASDFTGLRLIDLGAVVVEKLLEVFPLRSKSKGRRSPKDIFPLPTSKSILAALFHSLDERGIFWLICLCVSLNSLWGCDSLFEGEVNVVTRRCVEL